MLIQEVLQNPDDLVGKSIKIEGYLGRIRNLMCIKSTLHEKRADQTIIFPQEPRMDSSGTKLPADQIRQQFLAGFSSDQDASLSYKEAEFHLRNFLALEDAQYIDPFVQAGVVDDFAYAVSRRYDNKRPPISANEQLAIHLPDSNAPARRGYVIGTLQRDTEDPTQLILIDIVAEYHRDDYVCIIKSNNRLDDIPMQIETPTNVWDVWGNPEKYLNQTLRLRGMLINRGDYTFNIVPHRIYLRSKNPESRGINIPSKQPFIGKYKTCGTQYFGGPYGQFAEIHVIGTIWTTGEKERLILKDIEEAATIEYDSIYRWKL